VGLLSVQRAPSYREAGALSSEARRQLDAVLARRVAARAPASIIEPRKDSEPPKEVSRMAKGKNMQKEKKKPKKTKK
jgi:hypothetical protein